MIINAPDDHLILKWTFYPYGRLGSKNVCRQLHMDISSGAMWDYIIKGGSNCMAKMKKIYIS